MANNLLHIENNVPRVAQQAEVRSFLNITNVEDLALSAWTGSSNLTTLGTITTGVWNATVIAPNKGGTGISSYTAGNYINALNSTTLQQRTPSQVLSDIGALAASSYTAADVKAKLLTVDGAGSTIDSDLLDGQHGSFYQNASNLNAGVLPDARLSGTYTGISIKVPNAGAIFSSNDGADNRVVSHVVSYRSSSSAATGAIVFNFPSGIATVMCVMRVFGQLYANEIVDFTVKGYITTSWSQTKLQHFGTTKPTVRLGKNASGNPCIIIGDTTSTWSYPHFALEIGMFSHSGADDPVATGWTSALVTDLSAFTAVTANLTDVGIAANTATTLETARTINGVNFNGSANITITANTPNSITPGSGLAGSAFNGSSAQTISLGTPSTLTSTSTNSSTGSTHTHAVQLSYLQNDDDRSGVVRTTPDTYKDLGLSVGFNSGTNLGIGSTYGMSIHLSPWTGYNAGYKQQQLVFRGDGAGIFWRTATSDTAWGSYYQVHTEANFDPSTKLDVTANAASATKLATARNINGVAFDGTADITLSISSLGNALSAGAGLTGGSFDGSAAKSFVLGTPGSVTLSSTNNVTFNSHTHAFDPGGTAQQYIKGDGTTELFKIDSLTNVNISAPSSGQYLKYTGTFWTNAVIAVGDLQGTQAITSSVYQISTATLAGRSSAGTGSIEEITIGSGLSLSGGVLSATGGGGGGSGTVTSVGLSLPSIFSVSGSPVTSSGTLTATLASQTAKYFFAAPNAAAGAPTFRAIVASDIPTLNQNTTGSAATLTTARTINGTSFNGSANITTANWGTARTITIGSTGKSVNGSANVSWTLAELGAVANGGNVSTIVQMTSAAYTALGTKDANTLYVIVG